ncbi:MAG: cyclic nucleotide-binding domain-containing protein [Myxococcota bacterium]
MLEWLRRRWRRREEPADASGEPPPGTPAWARAAVFARLDPDQIQALDGIVREREVATGETLVEEGDVATSLFVVARGAFDVVKKERARDREHVIDRVMAGDIVGEAALFDALPRSATVRAAEPSAVYVVPLDEVARRAGEDPRLSAVRPGLILAIAEALAARLREQAADKLESAQQRDVMGHFVVNVLFLVCLYVYLLAGLQRLGDNLPTNTSYVSIPLQLVFGLGSWYFIRRSGYPLRDFGLSGRHLFGSVVEAIVFTVPALAVVTGVKWILIQTGHQAAPLIAHPAWWARLSSDAVWPLLTIYAVASLVQELVVRSALQSSLEMFLTGPRRVRNAIVLSALLFSVTHLHMSFLFATLAFLPGLFWGWLFARRRNLAGVTLSHIAVGGYVFFVLGVAL